MSPLSIPGGEKPLAVILQGDDLETLYKTSQTIRDQMAELPDFCLIVTVTGVERDGDTLTSLERRNGQRGVAYLRANLSENQALG